MLNHITAKDGHLVHYSAGSAFYSDGFERKSAKRSATMWFTGFCDKCDPKVFSLMENNAPVFTDFKQQLLFSYRTVLNKLRKIEHMHDSAAKIILGNSGISLEWKKHMDATKAETLYKLKYLQYYKHLFDREIYSDVSTSLFSTAHVSLPKVEIAATLVMGGGAIPKLQYSELLRSNPLIFAKPEFTMKHIFVTIIPTENSLELIMCWLTEFSGVIDYPSLSSAQFAAASHEDVFKEISDMLVGPGDHWAMSDAFYQIIQSRGIDKTFLQLKRENIDRVKMKLGVDFKEFSLFEGQL